MKHLHFSRRALALTVVSAAAMLVACGGGETSLTPSESFVSRMATETPVAGSLPATASLAKRASVVTITNNQLFQWAQLQYPELFGSAAPNVFANLLFNGQLFDVREFPGGAYLGISQGRVFGLGPFTNGQLVDFGVAQAFSAQVCGRINCGGTGGSGGTASLIGVVAVNGPVRNAVVCLDLNANNACDAGEPASAPTSASGAYTLSYNTSAVLPAQLASSSLIAPQVPGALAAATTTIDSADGQATTDTAYVLRQVPGKAGPINPLTTLVAAGVAAGMTEAVARANVASQLQIAEAKIDDYQADPVATEALVTDNARTLAGFTAVMLESGLPLAVGDPTTGTPASPNDQLVNLRFTDASNYSFRSFDLLARQVGAPTLSVVDIRQGRTNGLATAFGVLYIQAYLTTSGWRRCDASEPFITATLGVPNRSVFCGALEQIVARASSSVAGRSMAGVVTELQTDPQNVVNVGMPTANLLAALGAAVFPDNSALQPRLLLGINQPVFFNNLNTDGVNQQTATNLDQLIAARPASGAALPGPGGSLTLGLGSGNFKNLRVTFTGTTSATAGTVQFYECDLDSTQNVASNCAATNTGGYTIGTVNGVRVMRFTGNAPTVMNHEQMYVEVKAGTQVNAFIGGGDRVFRARQNKPDLASNITRNTRLNSTAWQAMKAQLGI